MSTEKEIVTVYIYDLSRGMARAMSQAFLGKQINGIWHTGIVVYGKEFFFGGTGGIECCPPGGTIMGQPDTKHTLGETQIPYEMFIDYLRDLSQSAYRPDKYHLMEHNCNTFSSDVAQFLTGNDIPSHITGLPAEVMATPFGQMIKPFIDSMSVQPSGGNSVFPTGVPTGPTTQGQSVPKQQTQGQHVPKQQPATQQAGKKDKPQFEPFVHAQDNSNKVTGKDLGLSSVETLYIQEIVEYLSSNDNMWSPTREHLNMLIRLVFDSQHGHVPAVLNLLAGLVLKEDIVCAFQHDPQSTFSQLLEKFEDCSTTTKKGILKMLTNCCSSQEGCKLCWSKDLQKTFTSVCVSGLLGDVADLKECCGALSYNIILGKVQTAEDAELEMGSALLTCCGKQLQEQTAFHVLSAVYELTQRNAEVKGLAAVLGVNVDSLQTLSGRVKRLCEQLKPLL